MLKEIMCDAVTLPREKIKKGKSGSGNQTSPRAESTMKERKNFLECSTVDLNSQKKDPESLKICLSLCPSVYLPTYISLKNKREES